MSHGVSRLLETITAAHHQLKLRTPPLCGIIGRDIICIGTNIEELHSQMVVVGCLTLVHQLWPFEHLLQFELGCLLSEMKNKKEDEMKNADGKTITSKGHHRNYEEV